MSTNIQRIQEEFAAELESKLEYLKQSDFDRLRERIAYWEAFMQQHKLPATYLNLVKIRAKT